MTINATAQPLYQRIYDQLREQIEAGELSPGVRIKSERQLAEEFGVSRLTVLKAVELLVREGFVERKVGSGTYITAHELHKPEVDRTIRNAAVLVPYGRDVYITNLVKALSQALYAHDCSMRFLDTNGDYRLEARHIEALCEDQSVDGLIAFPVSMIHNEALYQAYAETGRPLVLVDRYFPSIDTPFVGSDNMAGAQQAVSTLIEQRHRVIAHLCAEEFRNTASIDRRLGYERALLVAGIEVDYSLIGYTTAVSHPRKPEGSPTVENPCLPIIERWLARKTPPTAIFCTNDYILESAVLALRALKRRVPDEVALASFCDRTTWLTHVPEPFIAVYQHVEQIGAQAVDLLCRSVNIREPGKPAPRVLVEPELSFFHGGAHHIG